MDYSIPIDEEFKLEFCMEGLDTGRGDGKQQRWLEHSVVLILNQPCDRYYSHEDGVCKDFLYGGEKGNRNRFLTRQTCEASCFQAQEICELPKVGKDSVLAHFAPWAYDYLLRSLGLATATWSSSGMTWRRMIVSHSTTAAARAMATNLTLWRSAKTGKYFSSFYNHTNVCRCKKGTGPRRPQSPIAAGVDICNLPMKAGPGTKNTPAFYFEAKTGECAAFSYGGAEGNANRFESEEQCLRQCGSFKNQVRLIIPIISSLFVFIPLQDVCSFEKDFGPCVGRFKKYFYNSQLRKCEDFTFGGCGGNGNRFSSEEVFILFFTSNPSE